MPVSYAAGFDVFGNVNELPKAAKVAKHLGLKHKELRITDADLVDALQVLSLAHDEPFGDAANIPLYLMSKALQGEVKVVLQGDGGDEVFAGYRRYSLLKNADFWNLWPQFLSTMARSIGEYGNRGARIADALNHPEQAMSMALLLTSHTLKQSPHHIFTNDRRHYLLETTDPFLAYRKANERFVSQEPIQRMLLTDLTVQLPSTFLTKVDRSTMAAGVEARVPLLDERVAELSVGMSSAWKVNRREKKIILRKSQYGRLPEEILNGPKTGFGVPFGDWMRGPLSKFASMRLLDHGFLRRFELDAREVEHRFKEHSAGNRGHDFLLWKLLQLAIWQENYF